MPVDDSHEQSSLICFLNEVATIENAICCELLVTFEGINVD